MTHLLDIIHEDSHLIFQTTESAYGHAPQPHTVITNKIWLLHVRSSVFGTLTFALPALRFLSSYHQGA